jgi:mono/diheme cytochrome c family protein
MKKLKFISALTLTTLLLVSFTVVIQKKWDAPAKYKSMKNPTNPKDKDGMNEAKALYAKQCVSCHGKKGLGDGSKASDLKSDVGDFTSANFQKQTDGEIFYKMTEGRDEMPSFKKKIAEDDDRWLVVNFLRTLKK